MAEGEPEPVLVPVDDEVARALRVRRRVAHGAEREGGDDLAADRGAEGALPARGG